jgi:hypothetical protein
MNNLCCYCYKIYYLAIIVWSQSAILRIYPLPHIEFLDCDFGSPWQLAHASHWLQSMPVVQKEKKKFNTFLNALKLVILTSKSLNYHSTSIIISSKSLNYHSTSIIISSKSLNYHSTSIIISYFLAQCTCHWQWGHNKSIPYLKKNVTGRILFISQITCTVYYIKVESLKRRKRWQMALLIKDSAPQYLEIRNLPNIHTAQYNHFYSTSETPF